MKQDNISDKIASLGTVSEGVETVEKAEKGISLSQDAFRRLKKNKMAMFSLYAISLFMLVAVLAPILPIHSYRDQVIEHQFQAPSFKTAGSLLLAKMEADFVETMEEEGRKDYTADEQAALAELKQEIVNKEREFSRGGVMKVHQRRYILGTDALGRDLLARIIYGSQVSISIGLVGAIFSVLLGSVIGAIAGYAGGRVDYLLMRFVDVMYSLPYLMLVIILMVFLGRNLINLFLALSFISWLTTARVVRGQILSLKNSQFVEAARSIGASPMRIIFLHLLPNCLGIIIIFTTLRVPAFILLESFLSYLGLGISAPFTSWGDLIRDAVTSMDLYPWRMAFPALAMTLFLFSMNFLGDGLRDAFDPQAKNRL